ncbi:hypothetical protein HF521_013219 [Silurus meridionalis]|uniref:Uncharacterized protein n=1 Tax=Silurus meridionalis TaxID=175797 RepID=A0A8T0A8U8_SILME|nr:hypothetical protein HF521_013219 [Silurus meridionalis]
MKRERFKAPEPDDPLCCCDCEEMDDVCERLLCTDWEKPSPLSRFLPVHVDLSVLPPLVLLPVLLRIAALHCMLGIVVLTVLPVLVLWYYYMTHRQKRRTLFFLTLALFSLAYMYFLFITEIVPRGTVDNRQVVTATTGLIMTLVSLAHTKRGPGFVRADPTCPVSYRGPTHCNGVSQSQSPSGKKWCPVCRVLVNVSCNVTEREVHIALRNRTARSRLCGIVVETGVYTRGFMHNWIEFLTMNTHHRASQTYTHTV